MDKRTVGTVSEEMTNLMSGMVDRYESLREQGSQQANWLRGYSAAIRFVSGYLMAIEELEKK